MIDAPSLQHRVAEVKARLPIATVVERHMKLGGSASARNRRGKCPFHGSNSDSFSVATDKAVAHCFGCQWHGDVIKFTADILGWTFIQALEDLEIEVGTAPADRRRRGDAPAAAPIHRDRNPTQRRAREVELIEPIDMGRWIWRKAKPDLSAIRRYFVGRGVPESVLTDDRLTNFKFMGECPLVPWEVGKQPTGVAVAPAIIALVSKPEFAEHYPGVNFLPVACHITYLSPDGTSTMKRRKPWAKSDDADPYYPKRKMLGPVGGGGVMLGRYAPEAPLFVGEGNETTFSGMALSDAGQDAVGLAALSLETLQGGPRLWKSSVWPLFDIQPDPERGPLVIHGHRGPVVGLVDADMKPLRGIKDRVTGQYRGMPVVERKGGAIVNRLITGAERARICGELFVRGWRAAGVYNVRAIRAPMGKDFNDVIQEVAA